MPITALCSLLFLWGNSSAQQAYFQEETAPSPLSELKHVNVIAADKNNCIWIGTQSGIYRYDGSRLRHFSVLNTPVLKYERMASVTLFRSGHGSRWVLTDGKGYRYGIDSFSRLQPFLLRRDDSEIITYHRYAPPDLLIDQGKKVDAEIKFNTRETYSLRDSRTVFLEEINGDIISMGYNELFAGARGSVLYTLKNGPVNKTIATKNFFYVISPGGLLRWKDNTAKPEPVQLTGDILDKNRPINYEELQTIKTADLDLILLWNNGDIYEAIESERDHLLHTRLLISDAGKENPMSAFYSRTQHLFLSYYLNKGLVVYRPREFFLLKEDDPQNTGNRDPYYYAVLPEKKGFITVDDAGIIWLGLNGKNEILVKAPCKKFFLFREDNGNIWYQQGEPNVISYLQAGTKKTIPVIKEAPGIALSGLYKADDSSYYILTNKYFKKLVVKNGMLRSAEILYKSPDTIEFNVLYAFDPGILWLGSDRGLLQFNMADKSFKNILFLENSYIRAITRLSENNYLVGTYDKGIYQYKHNRWIHLISPGRKMPASAHAFIIDRPRSAVWVSSNEGLLRLSLTQLLDNNNSGTISFGHYIHFGPGLSAEFNGSSNVSGAKLSDSCIAFANAKGLVVFNPHGLVTYPLPQRILAEPVEKPDDDSIHFHDPYQIEFNPIVPYLGNLEDLVLLYHLTNANDNWHRLYSNSVISYNNVSPGKHDLQFRIRNYFDSEAKEISLTANSFTIPYRWYQRPLFQIFSLLFVLLLIIVIHNIRTWYLRKRKKELEQLVQYKTSELLESNEILVNVINDLSESEASLKKSNFLKDEYYAVLTHDLRSPLKFLSFNISQLIKLQPGLSNDAMEKGLFAAYQGSNDIYKLIDEFVYWIQENEKQLQATALPTMIESVINDVIKLYGYNLESNNNTLVTQLSPGLCFSTDPKMLFIVLRNAVDNANKYTTGGTITISVTAQNGTLQIIVADTGRGMNSELVRELTGLQYIDEQISYKQGRSLGFYIMAMLTKKLEGSYTITSVKDEGTSVCFILPELKT